MLDRRQIASLVGIAALAVVAAAAFLAPTRTPPSYTPRISNDMLAQARQQPVALVIGDGYAAGAESIPRGQAFPWRACATLQWVCNVDAQTSTGYLADGQSVSKSFSPYVKRVSANRSRYLADVIVVTGGRSDLGLAGDASLIANQLFSELRKAYPQAVVAAVEPFWINPQPPPAMARHRRAIQAAATEAGVRWIDTDDWLGPGLISDDGVYPNQAGHDVLGAKLAAALREMPRNPGGASSNTSN